MAQDSWPSPSHNTRNVTDAEYEKIAARFSDDGVWGEPADTQVVTAGVGLTVDVAADVYGSVRGHAWTSGTSTVNLAVTSNASGSTRVDRVVLRLDRSDWTVRAVVKAGTPGSAAPSLTQQTGDTGVYEIPLATVNVISGATSVTVARNEQYIGARIRPALSTARNPMPLRGEMVYETDTGRVRLWTGSAWTVVFDDSGDIVINSPVSAWTTDVDSVLQVRSGAVHLRLGTFIRAAGTLDGAGGDSRLPVLIPAAYRHPTRNQYVIAYTTGVEISRLTIYSANTDKPGQVWLTQHPTIAKSDQILPGSGLSWVVD